MNTPLPPGIQEEFDRGVTLTDEAKYDEAIAVFSRVLERHPNHAGAFLHRGRCWDRKADHQRALDDFTEVIRLTPHDARAHHFRGVSHAKMKQYEQAFA